MLIGILIIIYIVFLVLGFKSTWRFAVNSALAGSSEILLPIILFVIILLFVGPIMGIINLGRLLIVKNIKSKTDQNQ